MPADELASPTPDGSRNTAPAGAEGSPGAGATSPPGGPRNARPAIACAGLRHQYGHDGRTALAGLDLEVAPGEIFGFVGPNGAGKTTTIRILAGLLEATGGRATVEGADVLHEPQKVKRLVGYLPDEFGVWENMTLEEFLAFFAAAYGLPRKRQRAVIEDVLELTDLGPKRGELMSSFSRGMRQRAGLAMTLLHDPKVLLLDEPASGLDPRARVELRELLKELRALGKTILVSSHILVELSSMCTSIGILEAGRLVAAGPVESVLRGLRAARRFTLTLLAGDDAGRAVERLTAAGASTPRREGRAVTFDLEGSDEDAAALLEGLLGEGIRVVGFREEPVDLEEAFLTLTRGELA